MPPENIQTGNEWIPSIPEHWQFIRVKNLFSEIEKMGVSGKEDLLSVSRYTGVIPSVVVYCTYLLNSEKIETKINFDTRRTYEITE